MEDWADAFVFYLMIAVGILKLAGIIKKWLDGNSGETTGAGSWIRIAPYTHIVRATILFCGELLNEKGIKHFPGFSIRYYEHKKFGGLFNGEVVIYLKSNPDLESLVNTTLHEVRHYMQSVTDKQFKRYDELTRDYGYWDNPFEVDARAFAADYQQKALQHLESKQLIKRK